MRRWGIGLGGAFFVGFGAMAAYRLSPDALSMLIGLLVGVVTIVPLVGLFIWLLFRQQQQFVTAHGADRQQQYPPVIVVQPASSQAAASSQPPQLAAPENRRFTVVGGEKREADFSELPPRTWAD